MNHITRDLWWWLKGDVGCIYITIYLEVHNNKIIEWNKTKKLLENQKENKNKAIIHH
jgi:hypothetical protein